MRYNTRIVEQASSHAMLIQSGLAGLCPIKKRSRTKSQNLLFYNNAPNRQCNSTFPATELGFLLGSSVVSLLLNNCDLEARRRMHTRVPLRTGRVFYAVAWAVSEGPDRLIQCEESTLMNERERELGVCRNGNLHSGVQRVLKLSENMLSPGIGKNLKALFLGIPSGQLSAGF